MPRRTTRRVWPGNRNVSARRWALSRGTLAIEHLEERATPAVLVAAYAFNEGMGSSLADASGTGNGGTASNTAWSTAGKYGSALSFNGTCSLVNVADSASL